MQNKQHLFAVTRWLLKAAATLSVVIAALAILVLGAVSVIAVHPGLDLPPKLEFVARADVLRFAALALTGGLISAVLIFLAFRAAIEIVETAIAGDPFVNQNAKRLARIGWLLLGLHFLSVLGTLAVSALVPKNLPAHVTINIANPEVSLTHILTILFIFVLAQIFEHGSEMREQLDETI
jgi:Protein of unknown function (DUF2975)